MFDWFKSKSAEEKTPGEEFMDLVNEDRAKEEKPAVTYYRLGLTDNNRVSLQMGYSEITMNAAGVNNLIEQLELFRNQLHSNEIKEDNNETA